MKWVNIVIVIWITIVLNLNTVVLLAEKNIVGDVRNLSVKIVSFHDEDETSFKSDSTKLKLNVSWLPPESGKKPSFYSIVVTSISVNSTLEHNENNEEKNVTKGSCNEGTIYYAGQDMNETYVLLPENRFKTTINDETASELDIQPGCVYRVQVFANPRNNLGASPSTIIKIPECVGVHCNCESALDKLPMPNVTVKSFNNGSALISWQVDSSELPDVKSYKISAGVPQLTSSSGLVVYNKTQIFLGTIDDNSYLWEPKEKPKKGTKIFVNARDEYGCLGKEGSSTLRRIKPNQFYRINTTIASFVAFVMACGIMYGIYKLIRHMTRNHNYKLISLRNKSTRQINTVLHNSRIEALLRSHNILYVDHEIEEARRKELVDEYEISYSRLKIVREIGQGQFGKVYLANLLHHVGGNADDSCLVAVKMSLTGTDATQEQLEIRQELLEEIAITKIAGSHPHLVGLIGCCTLPSNPVCLVLEYMQAGDLLHYLHRLRDSVNNELSPLESPGARSSRTTSTSLCDSQSPTTPTSCVFFPNDIKAEDTTSLMSEGSSFVLSHSEMMRFALEIAKGMEHLEAKGIVHRDLATRNILMDANLVLKISDFGLSRKGTYTLGDGKPGVRRLPIRWMSPEAIRRRAFTSKSDVWSYGIVLWEIASLGDFPYPELSDDVLLRYLLEENGRPDVNDVQHASDDMKTMMDMCWARHSERRPSFKQIVLWLECKKNNGCVSNLVYQEVER